jgi:hypothetical protein
MVESKDVTRRCAKGGETRRGNGDGGAIPDGDEVRSAKVGGTSEVTIVVGHV